MILIFYYVLLKNYVFIFLLMIKMEININFITKVFSVLYIL